jgi:RNA polymerase sigma factor (sigma-70 family)
MLVMAAQSSYERLESLPDPQLLAEIRAGNSQAERALFHRYYARMVGFARARMNPRLQVRVAASDVAASAMKSVLLGVCPGEFDLDDDESLWPLLVTVMLNKVRNQWKRHTSQGRDLRVSQPIDACQWLAADAQQQSCQAELDDLVACLLAEFPPRRQNILRLALEGFGVGEIATSVGVTERTVYETRREAARCLLQLLNPAAD